MLVTVKWNYAQRKSYLSDKQWQSVFIWNWRHCCPKYWTLLSFGPFLSRVKYLKFRKKLRLWDKILFLNCQKLPVNFPHVPINSIKSWSLDQIKMTCFIIKHPVIQLFTILTLIHFMYNSILLMFSVKFSHVCSQLITCYVCAYGSLASCFQYLFRSHNVLKDLNPDTHES